MGKAKLMLAAIAVSAVSVGALMLTMKENGGNPAFAVNRGIGGQSAYTLTIDFTSVELYGGYRENDENPLTLNPNYTYYSFYALSAGGYTNLQFSLTNYDESEIEPNIDENKGLELSSDLQMLFLHSYLDEFDSTIVFKNCINNIASVKATFEGGNLYFTGEKPIYADDMEDCSLSSYKIDGEENSTFLMTCKETYSFTDKTAYNGGLLPCSFEILFDDNNENPVYLSELVITYNC